LEKQADDLYIVKREYLQASEILQNGLNIISKIESGGQLNHKQSIERLKKSLNEKFSECLKEIKSKKVFNDIIRNISQEKLIYSHYNKEGNLNIYSKLDKTQNFSLVNHKSVNLNGIKERVVNDKSLNKATLYKTNKGIGKLDFSDQTRTNIKEDKSNFEFRIKKVQCLNTKIVPDSLNIVAQNGNLEGFNQEILLSNQQTNDHIEKDFSSGIGNINCISEYYEGKLEEKIISEHLMDKIENLSYSDMGSSINIILEKVIKSDMMTSMPEQEKYDQWKGQFSEEIEMVNLSPIISNLKKEDKIIYEYVVKKIDNLSNQGKPITLNIYKEKLPKIKVFKTPEKVLSILKKSNPKSYKMNIEESCINILKKEYRKAIKFNSLVNYIAIPLKFQKSILIQQAPGFPVNIIKINKRNYKISSFDNLNVYNSNKLNRKDFSDDIHLCVHPSTRTEIFKVYSSSNIDVYNEKIHQITKKKIISKYISSKKQYLRNVNALNSISLIKDRRKMNFKMGLDKISIHNKIEHLKKNSIQVNHSQLNFHLPGRLDEKPNPHSKENLKSSRIFETINPEINFDAEGSKNFKHKNLIDIQSSKINELEVLESGKSIKKGIWIFSIKEKENVISSKRQNECKNFKDNKGQGISEKGDNDLPSKTKEEIESFNKNEIFFSMVLALFGLIILMVLYYKIV